MFKVGDKVIHSRLYESRDLDINQRYTILNIEVNEFALSGVAVKVNDISGRWYDSSWFVLDKQLLIKEIIDDL